MIPKKCVGKFYKEVIKHNLDEFLAKDKKITNLQADTLIDPDQSPFWNKSKHSTPFTVPLVRKGFNNPPLVKASVKFPPFANGFTIFPPLQMDPLYSPLCKWIHYIPPFRKGGLGGI
jgi:hypothetical protein